MVDLSVTKRDSFELVTCHACHSETAKSLKTNNPSVTVTSVTVFDCHANLSINSNAYKRDSVTPLKGCDSLCALSHPQRRKTNA